ncbi:MAG: cobalt/nickel transport system permease protein [Clostridiales bacterium]|jgi:cobalt/nickel transport system permease protein|nr:cobalt/nickel transport system permease protein [Clostridiales bacterium]
MLTAALPATQLTYAMHIAEGFLPKMWALVWYIVFIPFFVLSVRTLSKKFNEDSANKLLFALMAAFAFTLSSLKIPSIAGSCSHPTGMGLGAILLGPLPMVAIGTIVLLLQALLIAHGGITTLGANATSMAIAGPFVSFFLFKLLKRLNVNTKVAIFVAAMFGDLATYLVTSIQLGTAFANGNLAMSITKFMGVFMVTQLPISIAEGLLTVVVYNLLTESKQFPIFQGGISK